MIELNAHLEPHLVYHGIENYWRISINDDVENKCNGFMI